MAVNWKNKDELFAHLVWGYGYCKTKREEAAADIITARFYIPIGECETSLESICDALSAILAGIGGLNLYNGAYDPSYTVPYYFKNYADTTWQLIVKAWVQNDFEGRDWTIAVIDRMRQILWDEPFSITWAARPENREGDL